MPSFGNWNQKKQHERRMIMGDKSPKAIKKKTAHEQSKTKRIKKKEKHLALTQRSEMAMKRK